jgi:hypothetical protein
MVSRRARQLLGATKYHSDSDPDLDESYGAKVIFDADMGYRIRGLAFTVGATNLFNTLPDEMKHEDNRYNDNFLYSPTSAPAGTRSGTDAAFYYVRVEYKR